MTERSRIGPASGGFTRHGLLLLIVAIIACVPRSDRKAELMARAHAAVTTLEGAWVDGMKLRGRALFYGRGGCATCHSVDAEGEAIKGPNLGVDPLCSKDPKVLTERDPVACLPLAARVDVRRPGLSPLEYAVESIIDPDKVITPTYAAKVMRRLDEPPVNLTDDEIIALAMYVSASACPKEADAIGAAHGFLGECRSARDSATR